MIMVSCYLLESKHKMLSFILATYMIEWYIKCSQSQKSGGLIRKKSGGQEKKPSNFNVFKEA